MPGVSTRERPVRRDRLEFFSDAVLAVAITLMVLRISPPGPERGEGAARVFWNVVGPQIIFYLITFAVIVQLWRRHHDVFDRMPERVPTRQVVLNMAFLACVCLLPFGLEYYAAGDPTMFATAVYAVLIALCTLFIALLGQEVSGTPSWHGYVMCVVFLLAIPLAPLFGSWALLIWLIDIPLAKVWPRVFGNAEG